MLLTRESKRVFTEKADLLLWAHQRTPPAPCNISQRTAGSRTGVGEGDREKLGWPSAGAPLLGRKGPALRPSPIAASGEGRIRVSKRPGAGILTQGPTPYPPPLPPPGPSPRPRWGVGRAEKGGPQSGKRFKPRKSLRPEKNIFIILSILRIICRAEGIRNFKTAQREAGLSRGEALKLAGSGNRYAEFPYLQAADVRIGNSGRRSERAFF